MAFNSIKTNSQGMELMADKEEDRISGLPDDVLSEILSFLELRESVRTSVLSKRWEKVWTSIHRIHLNNESCLRDFDEDLSREEEDKRRTSYIHFVNGVLTGNNSKLSVTSFSLSYAFCFTIPGEIQYLTEWIAAVITPKLEKFDFLIRYGSSCGFKPIKLPPTLFECQNLVNLKLNGRYSTINIFLGVPKTVCLPRLEKLYLVSVQLEDENSLKNLLSGCPVLEELVMKEIKVSDNGNRNQNWHVFSPSLKILRMDIYKKKVCYSGFGCCYVVEAPKLEHLDLLEYSLSSFSMSSSPSLVSAVIHIATIFRNPNPLSVLELFQGISNVQKLEFSTYNEIASEDELANLPEFSNLIHLKIGRCSSNRHIVNCIIQKSPHLKHLIFTEDHVDSPSFMWSQRDPVPECLVLNLETIEISIGFNTENAMKIIEYFLDKGKALKKMAITTSFPVEEDFNSNVTGFPRASDKCQIVVSRLLDMSENYYAKMEYLHKLYINN